MPKPVCQFAVRCPDHQQALALLVGTALERLLGPPGSNLGSPLGALHRLTGKREDVRDLTSLALDGEREAAVEGLLVVAVKLGVAALVHESNVIPVGTAPRGVGAQLGDQFTPCHDTGSSVWPVIASRTPGELGRVEGQAARGELPEGLAAGWRRPLTA